MAKRQILIFLFVNVFALSIHAQSNDSTLVVWSEDFSGCYYFPTTGMNVEYSGISDPLSFGTTYAKGISPECVLSIKKGPLKCVVSLNGTYGEFTLKFRVDKISNIKVTLDDTKDKNILKGSFAKGIATYTFNVTQGIKSKTIYFSRTGSSNPHIDDIELTVPKNYGQPALKSPELSFSETECNVTMGERVVVPALKTQNELKMSFWSSDRSVATVDDNGKVTPKSPGRTTIYAISQGNAVYSYDETSYVLNVKRKAPEGEIFYESFDQNICGGGAEGIFYTHGGNHDIFYDSQVNSKSQFLHPAYKCINLEQSASARDNRSIYAIGPFNGVNNKKCTLSFRTAGATTPKTGGNDTVTVISGNKAFIQVLPYKAATWGNNSVVLDNVLNDNSIIEISGDKFYLDDVSLVVDEEKQITDVQLPVSQYRYSTLYYSDRALNVPEGMTAYTMKVDGDKIKPSKTYSSGEVIPKNEAVLIYANQGSYTMTVSDSEPQIDLDNQLRGTDDSELTTDGNVYYLFGVDKNNNSVGFFWGEANGAAFINGAHKAYLPLKETVSTQAAKALRIDIPENQTTNVQFNKIVNDDSKAPCYNLSGQRVEDTYRGIVIKNGRKILRR